MNDNATSGKEAGESNDELRARWEGANYGMTVRSRVRTAFHGFEICLTSVEKYRA